MPISDTYQKLIREAFKDMTLEQEKDFLVWALELYLKYSLKVLNDTRVHAEGIDAHGKC